MTTTLTTDILQLMASKICHDLISPIGAINNGIEFMEDMGPDAFEDATSLIGHSAAQASGKLQAYRIAYGAGGADGHIKPEDVKKAIDGMLQGDGKITQDWDAKAPMGVADNGIERLPAFSKMLICTILLMLDTLPKGGVIRVKAQGSTTTVSAEGENAAFREGIVEALQLALDNDALQPKHAHAVLTGLLGQTYAYSFTADQEEGGVTNLSFSYNG